MNEIEMNYVGEIAQPLIDALAEQMQSSPIASEVAGVWFEKGNCFPMAFYIMRMAKACGYEAVIVHGEPTLQREPFVPIVHGWVEIGLPLFGTLLPVCVDYSNGRRIIAPLGFFYSVGKIDPRLCHRYSEEAAIELLKEHGHFGFYHESDALSL